VVPNTVCQDFQPTELEKAMASEAPLRRAASSSSQPSIGADHPPVGAAAESDPLLIDCDRCSVRGSGCGDCVVTFLLGGPPSGVVLDDAERRAIDVLANAGLVPPLRMVHPLDRPGDGGSMWADGDPP
jgi:hypothetical protein